MATFLQNVVDGIFYMQQLPVISTFVRTIFNNHNTTPHRLQTHSIHDGQGEHIPTFSSRNRQLYMLLAIISVLKSFCVLWGFEPYCVCGATGAAESGGRGLWSPTFQKYPFWSPSRACERSGNSGAGGKRGEREQSGERVLKNKLSGSGAESGLNRPLKVCSHQHCIDLVTDILR